MVCTKVILIPIPICFLEWVGKGQVTAITLGISPRSGHAHGCFTLWISSVLFCEAEKKSWELPSTQRTNPLMSTLSSAQTADGSSVLATLSGHGWDGVGRYPSGIKCIKTRVREKPWSCLCWQKWHEIKSWETLPQSHHTMSVSAYVRLRIGSSGLNPHRTDSRLCPGPGRSEYRLPSWPLAGMAPLIPLPSL